MSAQAKTYTPRFKKRYDEKLRQAMTEKFGYKNAHQVPKLEKIVLNMGVGEASVDRKHMTEAQEHLSLIAGQKAVVTRAKKSVAGFKIREGQAIGCKVTLRRERMYEFLDRLVTVALPRVRDFRGVSPKAFDKQGNYAMGIQEHIVFPEINYDKVSKNRGLDIVICTSANTDEEAKALLEGFEVPFKAK